MNKFLLPFVTLAIVALPAAAHAEECRNSATGKFAKCGTAGAVPVSEYVKHGKTKAKAAPMATASAKPSMMSKMMMSKPTPTPTPSMTAKPSMMSKMMAKPTPTPSMTAKAKTVRCKNGNKFAKCGTPGAVPVA